MKNGHELACDDCEYIAYNAVDYNYHKFKEKEWTTK